MSVYPKQMPAYVNVKINSTANRFLLDQVVCSLSNFVILFLLAKFMDKSAYGMFVLLNTVMFVVMGLVNSMTTIPMQFYFNDIDPVGRDQYISATFIVNAGLAVLSVPFILGFFNLYKGVYLSFPLKCVYSSGLCLFVVLDFCRKANMQNLKTLRLLAGDLIGFGGRMLLVFFACFYGYYDVTAVFFVFSICLLGGVLCQLPVFDKFNFQAFIWSLKKNIRFGRWKLLGSLLNFMCDPIYVFMTGLVLGPGILGIYAAIEILARFSNIFMLSFTNYSISRGTRILKELGLSAFLSFLKKIYTRLLVILFAGSCLILAVGDSFLTFLRIDNSFYFLIPLMLVRVFIELVNQPVKIILNALKRPDLLFNAYVYTTFVTLVAIYPLIANFGVWGVALGKIITNLTLLTLQAATLFKVLKREGLSEVNQ